MDENNCALDELKHVQAKITSLFQDIINERYQCKINLKKSQTQAENLLKKINHLKKENEMLKVNIEKLKNSFIECIIFFQKSDLSCVNSVKVHDHLIEMFQKTISSIDGETLDSEANNTNQKAEIDIDLITNNEKLNLNEGQYKANIKKEKILRDEFHLSTPFVNGNCLFENLTQAHAEKHCDGLTKLKDILLMPKAENINYNDDLKPVQGSEESALSQQGGITPKKVCNSSIVNNSPVFRDLGNRKQDNLYLEAMNSIRTEFKSINELLKMFMAVKMNETSGKDVDTSVNSCKVSTSRLVNENFLFNTAGEVSPLKRTTSQADSFSPCKEIFRTKRNRTKLKLDSPKRSPKSQLYRSNSKEADNSLSGIRRFTQTLLNAECFKRTRMEYNNDVNRIKKGIVSNEEKATANEANFLDDEDDDVIMESPCSSQEIVEMYSHNKITSSGQKVYTPTGIDPDETFVSSSIVRKCKLDEERAHSKEENTPLKAVKPREKSPEFDSVPFFYKREAVRKKAERMKLPGQVCLECDKYYNIVFGGEINGEDFKKLINKCSRHRDKIPLDLDSTPPGFWKPYLTASVITSPPKNN